MLAGSTKKHRGGEAMKLGEVSFTMPPNDLRVVAAFLADAADRIEKRQLRSHAHIAEFDKTWDRRHPKYDVVVHEPGWC
ncbi:MAG: hypothetical protein AAGI68_10390 [Planctomycetota bacterium]